MADVSEAKQEEGAYMTELHTLETRRQWWVTPFLDLSVHKTTTTKPNDKEHVLK